MLKRSMAQELIRTQQQGLGNPIVSTTFRDYRVVTVGNTIFYSKKWKFFADFLVAYLQETLDPEWYRIELRKPLVDCHPIVQWHKQLCKFEQSKVPKSDGTYCEVPTEAVQCYLGLAYGLYLLAHNVELQNRLVTRLKDTKNFQGAYYEVIVANILICTGFKLELEDETDESKKHCEFSATSKKTERKYWVEAKMRSIAGLMGKTKEDGGSPTAKPTSRLTTHLRDALSKPAENERLIFIDVNAPEDSTQKHAEGSGDQSMPNWMQASIHQLEGHEKDSKNGKTAYVFVTNFPFHRHLDKETPSRNALAYGLGMDFGKPFKSTFTEAWKNKQKHIDAYNIFEAMRSYPSIPPTFDGTMSLTDESTQNQILIGNTYFFVIINLTHVRVNG